MDAVLTVRELTEQLRRKIEGDFPFVWVRGEVTNVSRPASGHLYFSLKDAEALLNCVWFRQWQREVERFDPLTGEVFAAPRHSPALTLCNGQQVICAGRMSVYAPRGSYQLLVELVQENGMGTLYEAFERVKRALAERGFFAQERKRPLPANPQRVAVVTAPGGAAVRDFLRIASQRGCGAEIRIYPASVQGSHAVPELVAAIQQAQADSWAQVLVLIRGGGSLEDLWAFNEEAVAEAVFQARLPVVAGIGHEVDFSMADLTADCRAATPTHAAQLLWPDRAELLQRLDETELALRRVFYQRMALTGQRLDSLGHRLAAHAPRRLLALLAGRCDMLLHRLRQAGMQAVERRERALEQLSRRLGSALRKERIEFALEQLEQLDARLRRAAAQWCRGKEQELVRLAQGLRQTEEERLRSCTVQMEQLALRLMAQNPLQPLERGYALVRDRSGRLVRQASDLQVGDRFDLQFVRGHISAAVEARFLEETLAGGD